MKRSQAIVAALYCLAAAILCRLPLFNALGYEFSVAIALLIPWFSGFWTMAFFRRMYRPDEPASFLGSLLEALKRNLFLLLLPFLIATLNIFLINNCSYGEGALFFLLIPVVTAAYTVALVSFCVVISRRPYLLYILITGATLLHPVCLGFGLPQIYSYNVIYGFFPGISYDELISISGPLIVFRLITLVAALWYIVLAIFFLRHSRAPLSVGRRIRLLASVASIDELSFGVIVGFVFLLLSWVFRAQLGFETPAGYIERTLNRVRTTEHFRIHYAAGEFNDQEMNWVAAGHEFRYAQVAAALQTDGNNVIDSYIYPDAATKRKFIGAGNTNIAKPWRHEIHINKDAWDGVLRHELVHVLAGNFGMPVIKANYSIGIVEGLATAIDDDFGNRTLHEYAAAMLRFGLVDDPGAFLSLTGFATQSSQRSYVLMGSFCKFLIDRYGIIRFKLLYGGNSPRLVYGLPYGMLIAEWQDYLERIDVPAEWQGHVEYYFNRPSIFAKECARKIAEMNDRGWRYLDERQPRKAMDQFRRSLQESWNTEAFGGMVRSAFRSEKYDSVIVYMREQRNDSVLSSNLLLYYGDALWSRGDTIEARKVYRELAALDLSDGLDEMLALRMAALDDPRLRGELAGYFLGGNDSTMHALLHRLEQADANPILSLLDGRIAARRKEYYAVIRDLDRIGDSLDVDILNAGREQLLADCFFHVRNFQRAKEHYWYSLNYVSNHASINAVEDLIEQCDWYSEHFDRYRSSP